MHRRRLLTISLCCFAVIAAIVCVSSVLRPAATRMDVRLVDSVAHDVSSDVTAEICWSKRSAIATESLQLQFHVAGKWGSPEVSSDYDARYLPTGTNVQSVVFTVPAGADACRFLLGYRTMRMGKCRAYSLINRYGLGDLPGLWKIKLANMMSQPSGLRQAQCELTLPPAKHEKLVAAN